MTQMLVPRLVARAWWPVRVRVAAAACVRGMSVTVGLFVCGSLRMNAPSTLRAGSAVGRADSLMSIREDLSKDSSPLYRLSVVLRLYNTAARMA